METGVSEISSLAEPKTEVTKFVFTPELSPQLTKIEGVKPVSSKPAKVTKDIASQNDIFGADLPFKNGDINDAEILPIFARTITADVGHPDSKVFSFKTPSAGRSSYFSPVVFSVSIGESKPAMSAMMIKGSGSLHALETSGSPFGARDGGEIEGAVTMGDLRKDAANSKRLAEAGIRTRVALGIYSLDEIDYEGKIRSPDDLTKEGIVKNQEDLPGIGIFTSRTALRTSDLAEILKTDGISSIGIEGLLLSVLQQAKYDDTVEFQALQKRHEGLTISMTIPPDKREIVLADYLVTLSKVLGKNAARLEKLGVCTRYINPKVARDNLTCLAELVDNSQVQFSARPDLVIKSQEEILSCVSSIPSQIKGISNEKVREMLFPIRKAFMESYLNEATPGWETNPGPQKFIEESAKQLNIDIDKAKMAYWVAILKINLISTSSHSFATEDLNKIIDPVIDALYSGKDSNTELDNAIKFLSLVYSQTTKSPSA